MRHVIYVTLIFLMSFCNFLFAVDEKITQGCLQTEDEKGTKINIPLEHTDVKAHISGFVARVYVTQKFVNPFNKRIEAIYVFPLPQNAAVDSMLMKIGDRIIRGVLKKREEAREIYEQARKEGKTASLLEQERPNIFTQSVANILPGDTILVTISYIEVMDCEQGQYEFVFPMVVGPRYIPGDSLSRPPSGTGWAVDTDKVPDASRITPHVLPPGFRTGHDISLQVHLNAGIPIQKISCKSHVVKIDTISNSEMSIKLTGKDIIPNKDFILNYHVVGEQLEMALLTHKVGKGGYFLLIIQPKIDYSNKEITSKEMVFVVDNSGSMSGEPIAKAKEAMRHCLKNMNKGDTFQIIKFSEAASNFSVKPLLNTPENVRKGLWFINEMHGSGGTRMIEGIKAALGFTSDAERMRTVLFMTDGYIGNEQEIFNEINKLLGKSRLFSFGVGSSVNRYLLDRMAEIGRGAVQYVTLDENTDQAVAKFYDRIASPYLTDISIDWGDAEISDVYPSRIPDLFSAQPVVVVGRYKKGVSTKIKIHGFIKDKKVALPLDVNFQSHNAEHDAIKILWARNKIKDLKLQSPSLPQETITMITNVALEFKIMSEYTAFVAVEDQVRADGTVAPVVVNVPVPMPAGVSYEGVFGVMKKQSLFMHSNLYVAYDEHPAPIDGITAIQQALVYPELAKKAGIEGTVIVQVKINENGEVIDTKIVTPLGNCGCNEAAIAAIKAVKWKPAKQREKPTPVWISVPIQFKLKEKGEELTIGNRTFVKRENFWVEKTYKGEQLINLKYNSKKLNEFVKDKDEIKLLLKKLGKNIIFKFEQRWYEIVE